MRGWIFRPRPPPTFLWGGLVTGDMPGDNTQEEATATAMESDSNAVTYASQLAYTEARLRVALDLLDLDALASSSASTGASNLSGGADSSSSSPAKNPSILRHSPSQEQLALLLGDLAPTIEELQSPKLAISHTNHKHPQNAIEAFARGFALSYFVRAGIGTFTRAVSLVTQRKWLELTKFDSLLSEKSLVYRVDAVRWGLAVGGFNFTYHVIRNVLARKVGTRLRDAVAKRTGAIPNAPVATGSQDSSQQPLPEHTFIAALVAGLSLLAHEKKARRTVALYAVARAMQSLWNSQARKRMVPDQTPWARILGADATLFCLACAQIQYAYVMRPDLLGKRYYNFIVKNGPIDGIVLEAVRNVCRRKPVDVQALHAYALKHGNHAAAAQVVKYGPRMRAVPLSVMAPQRQSSVGGVLDAFITTFKKVFPLYLSVHLVPFAVFQPKKALRQPVASVTRAVVSGARSASFLGSFCVIYFTVVAAHRKLAPRDHKSLYWFAGAVAGLAVYVEKQSRRSELTMYVLPRALDAAYCHLRDRKLLKGLPFGDVFVFSLSIACLMSMHEHEPDAVAPLLRRVLSRLVSLPVEGASPIIHVASSA